MIKSLPSEVKNHLRSGISITSIAQCIEELVLNSLDACATCIAIRIDVSNSRVQVVDNGSGIQREDLDLIGCWYSSSKTNKILDVDGVSYFGYRGEALASICDLCELLELSTRHKLSSETYTCTFHLSASKVIRKANVKRPSSGTTVTVSNLFHRCPVRRKCSSDITNLECICARIKAIALIHPETSFSIRDDITGRVLLKTNKTDSINAVFGRLFGQEKSKFLKKLRHQSGNILINGVVSTELHHNKDLQVLYVNRRCVQQPKLEQLISQLLEKALFARQKKDVYVDSNQSSSSTRTQNRYAIYMINISCPLSAYDIISDPGKTRVEFTEWILVHRLTEYAIKEFLHQENIIKSPLEKASIDDESSSEPPAECSGDGKASTCCNYGQSISTVDLSHALHSVSVGRIKQTMTSHCITATMLSVAHSANLMSEFTDSATTSVSPSWSTGANGAEDSFSWPQKVSCTSVGLDGENDSLGMSQQVQNGSTQISASHDLSQPLHTVQLLNTCNCEQNTQDTVYHNDKIQMSDNVDSFSRMLLFSDPLPESNSNGSSMSCWQRDKTISLSSSEVDLSLGAIRQDFNKTDGILSPKLRPHIMKGIDTKWYKIRERLANQERVKRNQTTGKDTNAIVKGTEHKGEFCNSQTFLEGFRKICSELRNHQIKSNTNYGGSETNLNAESQSEHMAVALSADRHGVESSAVTHSTIKTSIHQQDTELALMVKNSKMSNNSLHQLGFVNKPSNLFMLLDTSHKKYANNQNKNPEDSSRIISSAISDSQGHCFVESRQHAATESLTLPSSIMMMDSLLQTCENVNFNETSIDVRNVNVATPSQPKKRQLSSDFITDSDEEAPNVRKSKRCSQQAVNNEKDGHGLCFSENSPLEITTELHFHQTKVNSMNINQSDKKNLELSSHRISETHYITDTASATLCERNISNSADSRKCITQPNNCLNANISCCFKSWSSSSELDHCNAKTFNPSKGAISTSNAAVEVMNKVESEGFLGADLSQSFMIFPQTQEFNVQHLTPFNQEDTQEFHVQSQLPGSSLLNHSDSADGSTGKMAVNQDSEAKGVSEVQVYNNKSYSEYSNHADVGVTKIQCVSDTDGLIWDNASDFKTSNNVILPEGQAELVNDTKQVYTEHSDSGVDKNSVDTNHDLKDEVNKHQDVTVICQTKTDADVRYMTAEQELIVSGREKPSEVLLDKSSLHADKWVHQMCKTGHSLYVNLQTGFSSYTKPATTEQPNILTYTLGMSHPMRQCTNSLLETFRHHTQKLTVANSKTISLSPRSQAQLLVLFNQHKEALGVKEHQKWRSEEYKLEWEDTKASGEMFASWNNLDTNRPEKDVLSLERITKDHCTTNRHQILSNYKLTKDALHAAKVIGQLDNKFIVCLLDSGKSNVTKESSSLLVLIDQHAAHERLRLETLIHESFDICNGHHQYHSFSLMPSVEMALGEDLIRNMCLYKNQFKKFGLHFSVSPARDNCVIIHAVPACLLMKDPNQLLTSWTSVTSELIESFIKEEAQLLHLTHGACEAVPQAFIRCLASVACHGAIKFGDKLTLFESVELVSSLSDCDLPFQCAHGRPSTIPLLDLSQLYDTFSSTTNDKPQLSKLSARMRMAEKQPSTQI